MLTGLAAMLGAFFILDDPIFNGLAISLIFGILVTTVLTLVVIPLLYFVAYRRAPATSPFRFEPSRRTRMTSWQIVRLVRRHLHPAVARPRHAGQPALRQRMVAGASPRSSAPICCKAPLTRWCPMEIILRKLGVQAGC